MGDWRWDEARARLGRGKLREGFWSIILPKLRDVAEQETAFQAAGGLKQTQYLQGGGIWHHAMRLE